MTRTQLNDFVDEKVTNKTALLSLTPAEEGSAIKKVADYVDQEIEGLQPYKKYVALITQTGTNNPNALVLENTLGGTVVWTRSSTGVYYGTLTGVFTNLKTWCMINPINIAGDWSLFPDSLDTVQIKTWDNSTDAYADGYLNETSIEIRVYN